MVKVEYKFQLLVASSFFDTYNRVNLVIHTPFDPYNHFLVVTILKTQFFEKGLSPKYNEVTQKSFFLPVQNQT